MRFPRIIACSVTLAFAFAGLPAVAHPAFPGRNGKIAFEDFFHGDISTVNPDGSGRSLLIPVDPTYRGRAHYPAWSPDGKKIAYENTRIFVANADGTGEVDLGVGYEPAWSPDGTQLVFARDGGGRHLWIMNADGTGRRQLTQNFIIASKPAWSPDGRTIAFVETELSAGPIFDHIALIDPDGGNLRQIGLSGGDVDNPDWSPDGRRIVFNTSTTTIAIMDPDSGNQTPLRIVGQPEFQKFAPAWSPDGKKIAYSYGLDIWVVNPDGTNPVNVTNTPGDATHIYEDEPSWQPLPNGAPDCSGVKANPDSLLPPNHKLRPITLSGGSDPDGDALTLSITAITQDEPVRDREDNTGPDAVLGPAGSQASLRAERNPQGDGRVYWIAFTLSDGTRSCSGRAPVEVRRHPDRPAEDSSPPAYDSTATP